MSDGKVLSAPKRSRGRPRKLAVAGGEAPEPAGPAAAEDGSAAEGKEEKRKPGRKGPIPPVTEAEISVIVDYLEARRTSTTKRFRPKASLAERFKGLPRIQDVADPHDSFYSKQGECTCRPSSSEAA